MFGYRCLRFGLAAGLASLTLAGAPVAAFADSGAAFDPGVAGAAFTAGAAAKKRAVAAADRKKAGAAADRKRAVAATIGGEWTQPGFGPGRTFYNPAESILNAATIGKVKDRFATDLPEPPDESCSRPAPPLVSGGRVFVAETTGIGAYAISTGALLWQHSWQYPEDESTPYLAVSNGLLIAGNSGCQSASDPNGAVRALDLATGKQRWSATFDTPTDSLVVDRGVVAIGGDSSSDLPTVRGLDAATGRVRWTLPRYSSPGVSAAGRLLLTRTSTAAVVAVTITTGKAIWTKPRKWYAETSTPAGDRFFVTNGAGTLISLNAATGASQWTAPKLAGPNATDGRRIYHPTGTMVEAYDVRTGKRVWWRSFLGKTGQPVRAGGLVYVAVEGKKAAILNAANGTVVPSPWSAGLAATNRVTVAGGTIYTVAGTMLTASAP